MQANLNFEEEDSPFLQSSGDIWKMDSEHSQPVTESQSSFSTHSQGKNTSLLNELNALKANFYKSLKPWFTIFDSVSSETIFLTFLT